ncbi:major antigen-like [Pseudomyrmex gracilis]|uniref:major antigen-like n=1 Tax=Pseudomyrmex gracilis TaxID=219809 RepID=UPI000995709F|nr:major antigen-like [Pseudomyrmex gracilis]
MMSDEYLDKYLPVIAFDVVIEEKIRIAKRAATTLHKLHYVMQQIKEWRDDSAKLKSNIWRMKMALRADDDNGNDNQQNDLLIVHQKAEISRLEQAKDALENEVTSLRQVLMKTKEDITRISVCELGNEIIRIGDGFLCEKQRPNDNEIQGVSKKEAEDSCETSVALNQLKNKLRKFAMSDRTIEAVFANAIGKIVETVVGLSEELVNVNEYLYRFKAKNKNLHHKLDRLKAILRSKCGSSAEYRKKIGKLNKLVQQLMSKLDRLKVIRENANSVNENFDVADSPDVIGHVENLINDLRNNLKSDREAIIVAGDPDCLRYMKKVIDLRVNLKVLFVEFQRSNAPIDEQSTCDNVPYDKYLVTASLFNDFLKKLDSEIGKSKMKPMDDKYCKIGDVSGSQYMTKIVELEDIVRKSVAVIAVVKQTPFRMINVNEKDKIEELENLIERMYCKVKNLEFFDDRASLREKIEQLETLVARLKLESAEKTERENALSGECKSVRSTLDCDRKKYERIIAIMREENVSLRENIMKREQEISTRERERSEQRVTEVQLMKTEIDAVRQKLQSLHDDKETLLGEAEGMRNILRERDKEIENIITQRDALAEILRTEVEELRMKLEIASDENVKLKSIIEVLGNRKVRPDKLKSSEEKENDRDNSERYSRSCPRNNQQADELEAKEERSEKDDSNKYTALQDQVKKFTFECEGLREKISEREAAAENFKLELERTRTELEDAVVEVARLRAENSRIVGDLDTLSVRHTETEDRVRVLLTEKNELATRINVLDDENVALQERLNKARAENEYLSMELNKSRVDNDEARAQNALLRVICDERKCEMNPERDDASVGRMFGVDQLGTQNAKRASYGENNDQCRNHLRKIYVRDQPEKDVRGFADVCNEITYKQDCSDATRTNVKVEIGKERRDGETVLKVESDTCAGRDNKAKIKDTPKAELKSSEANNKALKLKRANLRFENSGITMELARTKDRSENSPLVSTNRPNNEEIIDPRLRTFPIVNIDHEKKMSDYPDDFPMTYKDKTDYSTIVDIDRLVAENKTLKLEVGILRGSLDSSRTDSEKTKIDLRTATDEIQALKLELMNLRTEKAALRSRFEMLKEELNELKSERTALKDELAASRKSNFNLRLKANDLRCANERLKETNTGLQSRLQDALTRMNDYIAVLDERFKNNVESALNSGLEKYNLAKRNLRALAKRLNQNECVLDKSLGPQTVQENLQHIEGHK